MEMQQKFGVPLAVILVDTMSAAAGFADENSAADVQPVMDVLHELAKATSTLVIAIDHYGKAPGAGTRGSNAKESSANAVLALEKTGNHHAMTVRKLRSGPDGARFGYSLEPVSFGFDVDGDEITTCIVKFDPHKQGVAPAANAWKGLQELKKALDTALAAAGKNAAPLQAVRQEFYKQGNQAQQRETRRRAFNRQLKRGRDSGLICTRDINGEKFVWISTI